MHIICSNRKVAEVGDVMGQIAKTATKKCATAANLDAILIFAKYVSKEIGK